MKTPRSYQQVAIDRAVRKPLLDADPCGSGKTLVSVEAAKRVQAQIGKPVLIVAPSEIVKRQWLAELQDQGIASDRILWLDSNTKQFDVCDSTIVLTHYEAMRKHIEWLKITYWSLIIADEAHRIKNRKALRTQALKELKCYRKIALTGTPYDRDPSDIWSILNWLDPQFFSSYWKFYEKHIAYDEIIVNRSGQHVKQIQPQPLKDPATFARVLRPYMLRRTKDEINPDLPENIIQYIDLDMGNAQAKAYAQLVASEDPIVTIDGQDITAQIALTQILREIQMTTDPALLGLKAPSVKLDWVNEWLTDNPNESVIIFTRFAGTARKLHASLDGFTLVIGGEKKPDVTSATKIIATIGAASEGLDLPHIDHAIFIDVEWSSILMQQAIDRIHRMNITNVKHSYYLRCIDTTDFYLHNALAQKWSTKELIQNWLSGKAQNLTGVVY